ncbi:MAG: discoidin domain-containing protein [Tannerellaceae bacterium]|nr:discoidin domain-containing protein [Tannerellaceae bacterium]
MEKRDIKVVYSTVRSYQAAYLRSLQSASGAIKDTEQSNSRICPYFANFACLALLKDPTAENVTTVKRYMLWYMGKLNGSVNPVTGGVEIPGSVYDYYGDEEITQGTYDSIDSYAATFLMLAKELAGMSADNKAFLADYTDRITLIAGAMEKCIDTEYNTMPGILCTDDNDGLSIASYVYDAKYLMDNCEVNEGLRAAVWLKENGLIGSDSGDFVTLLANNTAAIESELWRQPVYNWIDNGNPTPFTQWGVFYPDATSQLYPGLFGVIPPGDERARKLYLQFNRYYPNWPAGEVYSGNYPWAVVAYAAATINDVPSVQQYITHIYSYNVQDTQKPYWYSAEAAFVLLAIDKIHNPEVEGIPNLALHKPATGYENFNDPALAVDGDFDTRWSAAEGTGHWFMVDLLDIYSINTVIVRWEAAYASGYDIQVSTDNENFTTVYTTITGQGGVDRISFANTDARYVKIILNEAGTPWFISFWEFEVYNMPQSVNLALRKPATGHENFNDPALGVDGDLDTRWSATAGDGHWFQVDLEKVYRISRIRIVWEDAYASEYAIQVSTDNVNFTTVFNTTNGIGGTAEHTFLPIEARYVKLLLQKAGTPWNMSFWEFEVYEY